MSVYLYYRDRINTYVQKTWPELGEHCESVSTSTAARYYNQYGGECELSVYCWAYLLHRTRCLSFIVHLAQLSKDDRKNHYVPFQGEDSELANDLNERKQRAQIHLT